MENNRDNCWNSLTVRPKSISSRALNIFKEGSETTPPALSREDIVRSAQKYAANINDTQYPANGEIGEKYLPIQNFLNSVNPTAIAMGIPNQAGVEWITN